MAFSSKPGEFARVSHLRIEIGKGSRFGSPGPVARGLARSIAAAVAAALAACGGAPSLAPGPTCPARCDWAQLAAAVDSAVADGAAPGAVVAISATGSRFYHSAGRIGIGRRERPDARTVYDLASLTKVVALTTLAMIAVDEGKLELDAPVATYLPGFAGRDKDRVTVRHLLTHSSGLPAHRPLWKEAPSSDSALALVLATPLETLPGARAVYSDLGAITVGLVIERLYGERLSRLAEDRVFRPLGLGSTRYLPPRSWLPRVAPTENDPWRARVVHGEVHDENAAFLGGVSGHAGLFGSAEDLLRFGEWLLSRYHDAAPRGKEPRLSSATVRRFTARQDLVAGSSRALGWDTPSPGSSAGTRLAPGSFGHTGFTGTSIWIDPTRELVVVLLSNRVHPSRDNPRLAPLRGLVADRVVGTLEGSIR
jgi:CubicO group peptidase (beta-lactamase class C family)